MNNYDHSTSRAECILAASIYRKSLFREREKNGVQKKTSRANVILWIDLKVHL